MHDMNRSSTLTMRRAAGSAASTTGAGSQSPARAASAARSPAPRATDVPQQQPAQPAAAPAAGERVLRSDALLQGRSHVSIAHNGETYQLRATRLGKLILTK